jgi:hypothetical protein
MKRTKKEQLLDLARTSVDDARSSIRCRERNGNPLSLEECEILLEHAGAGTFRTMIEAKARKAFRESVRREEAHDGAARLVAAGVFGTIEQETYSTLRRALYLATDPAICERIRSEIKTRFPRGSPR